MDWLQKLVRGDRSNESEEPKKKKKNPVTKPKNAVSGLRGNLEKRQTAMQSALNAARSARR